MALHPCFQPAFPQLPIPLPYKTWRCEQDSHARALKHLQEAAVESSSRTRRTRKLPITHYTLVTWFTWETVSSAGARSKTDGVLNCTSWPHVPTPAYMCMGSNHSLVGRSGPSVGMTCCLSEHHWLPPQRSRHGKYLLRPTHSTLVGVSSGWVGLRLLACLLPHPFLLPPFLLAPFLLHPFPLHLFLLQPFPLPPFPLHLFLQLTHPHSESTCTQALHQCEQRGKPQCCQPASKSNVATVKWHCTTVYIYFIMIEVWWLDR